MGLLYAKIVLTHSRRNGPRPALGAAATHHPHSFFRTWVISIIAPSALYASQIPVICVTRFHGQGDNLQAVQTGDS